MDPVKRYYGIYRAVVKDTKDPKGLRRIKVSINQITDTETTDWIWPVLSTKRPPKVGTGVYIFYIGGDPDYPVWIGEFGNAPQGIFSHGSFYSTQTQTNAGATSKNIMTCNNTDISQGVSIVGSSKLTVELSGTYNIQFSAQFDKTDSGNDNADIWLSKNGTNIPNSNTRIELDKNDMKVVAAWNWFVKAKAKDYFQINWSSADVDMRLYAEGAQTGPTRPGIPSVIVTVNQIA
jgi:hypothetical protein